MIGKVLKDTNIGEKNWISFYDENNRLSLFFGDKISENEIMSLKEDEEERKHFTYTSNTIYKKDVNNDIFLGEKIVFKTLDNDPRKEEIIRDLFDSISSGLNDSVWKNLREALDDLAKFFSLFGKEDNVIKGYIGEVSIIYEILFNSNFNEKISLCNYLIGSYQKTEKRRHDYSYSSKLKIEVKSTSSERNTFKIDHGQQKTIREGTNLIYAFVKYNYNEQKIEGWKTLNEMIEEIKNYEGIIADNWNKANHLMLVSKRYRTSEWRIDPKNIELFLLNSKVLPVIENTENKYITEIKYKFDLDSFMVDKKYNDNDEFLNLLNLFIDEERDGNE